MSIKPKSTNRKREGMINIKQITLKPGQYNESTLVDMVCTAAQQKSYHKKEKFTNNKQRSMFVERLSCLCEFEYTEDTNKYKICKVYQYPKTKAEVKIHKGIYRYLAPLILDKVVNDRNGRQSIFSVYELTKDTNMTNKNYGTMKFAQDEVSSGLSIPYKTVAEYFDKTDGYIYYYIKKCIQYLAQTSCLIFNEVHLIKKVSITDVHVNLNGCKMKGTPNIHVASKDEMDLYAKLMEQADNEVGVKTSQERWFGNKAHAFQDALSKLLRDNNISYVTKGFEMYAVHLDRCQEIMQTFSNKPLEYYRQVIGAILKKISDDNAEIRTKNNSRTNFDKDYLENFKNLSELSLPYDAEDITIKLPALKESYQQRLKNRSELMECLYTEGGLNLPS